MPSILHAFLARPVCCPCPHKPPHFGRERKLRQNSTGTHCLFRFVLVYSNTCDASSLFRCFDFLKQEKRHRDILYVTAATSATKQIGSLFGFQRFGFSDDCLSAIVTNPFHVKHVTPVKMTPPLVVMSTKYHHHTLPIPFSVVLNDRSEG